jgi:hypothetical protein
MSDQAPASMIPNSGGAASVTMKTIARAADGSVDPSTLMKPREASGNVPPSAGGQPQADPAMQNAVAGVLNRIRAPQPAPRAQSPAPPAPAAETPVTVPDSVLPAATPAAATEIPEAPPGAKDDQATFTWARLRSQAKAAEAAAAQATMEATAKALEAQKNAELVAQLQIERDEANARLEKTDLLNSPSFHERYDGRINAAKQELIANLSQVVETPEMAASLTDKLLGASQKEFIEVLNKLPQVFQPMAFSARTTVAKTVQEREAAVADWKTTRAALAEQSAKDQRIKLATDLERGTATAADNVAKNGNFLLQKNGDPNWDAQVDAIVANAKMTLAQPRSMQDIVDLVMEGASAAKTRDLLVAERQRVKQLEAQLKSVGAPPVSSVRPAPAPAPQAPPPSRTPPNARRPSLIQDTIGRLGITR